MRLGIIGRADRGGIAAQTLSVARNLPVDAALIVDISPRKGRGPIDLEPWHECVPDVRKTDCTPATDDELDWIIERSDVIYAPEGPVPWRDEDFLNRCEAAGVPFVIHVNPELFRPWYRHPASRLTLPTRWHEERFPDATYLPMPTEPDRFPHRTRTGRTFLHVGAPAMLDRNGTELVRQACAHVKRDTVIYTRGILEGDDATEQLGQVEVRHLGPARTNAEVYPDDADVLLLPRRYGGNCQPMLEAASLGMPLLTLNLEPQVTEGPPGTRVPVTHGNLGEMIGGDEMVWEASPESLAATMDAVEPEAVEVCSAGAVREWAQARCWDAQRERWLSTLTP